MNCVLCMGRGGALLRRRRNEPETNRFRDSSLDRSDGERRGSLPLVTGLHAASMESVTTTSRLASFFSKKGFRSNLKRTKSATKLDRKQSTPNLSEGHDSTSLMGSLKRTMSLGRLSRKRKSKMDKENQSNKHLQQQQQQHHIHGASSSVSSKSNLINNTPHSSPALSLISARIRSSRSHESLLTSSHPSMHSINLSDPDVEVKPLHSSVLGQGHCFHVATPQGSKYISCTTSEERDKWMYSLRRTACPGEEHCRRTDNSLKLWVVEAKNLPAKKSYYCDIFLDKTRCAMTSVKSMTDMLFWGEHFEFKSLGVIETVTINLFREADKKKKKDKDKDILVGYINLAIEDLNNRQMFEKWITCNSATVGKAGKETKSELPIIRIKARKQKVEILPLDAYQSFIKYLTTDYLSICAMLESVLVVREKEEFATSLVHILQTQGKACQFLCDIIMDEIDRLDDEHLTFRGNSIATKAMEAYMKLVGKKYLTDTLGEFIRSLISTTEDCEVDPTKVSTPQLLSCQQGNLEMYCDVAWNKVMNSFSYFPNEMREVFSNLRSKCAMRGKSDYSDNLISGCIFLRFLCPAILYPNLFHLTQEYPHEKASRKLTLIAKTIQTLANFTQFGTKEEFMTFMNKFVQREEESMKIFLHKISSQEAGNEFLQYDGDIDLGKELSVLHCLLLECRDKYAETSGNKFEHLNNFLNTISSAFDDPTVGQKKPQRISQIYDNMLHTPSPIKQAASHPINIDTSKPPQAAKGGKSEKSVAPSSPTEVLRDMLRHCGESMDDLPALTESGKNQNAPGPPPREKAGSDLSLRKSKSRSGSYSGEEGSKEAAKGPLITKIRPLVADVSVDASGSGGFRKDRINESWNQMVNAADSQNGDYIDLIPFMDEDVNMSMEMEPNTPGGSQASIGQSSTVGSSGYQSFSQGQSQSDSPVESSGQQEGTRELTKSPIIQYPLAVQPLAFANPLFGHQQPAKSQCQKENGNLQHNQYSHHHHQQPRCSEWQQPQFRSSTLKSTNSMSSATSGYAGSMPVSPHPTPQPRHAKTVQRKSSDSSASSEDSSDESQPKRRGYKVPLRSTTNVTPTTTTKDYQTSIAPLKKLSQLSSSSSDEESSNETPRGIQTKVAPVLTSSSVNRHYSSSNNNSSFSSSSSQYPTTSNSSSSSSSSAQNQPVSSSLSSSSSSTLSSQPMSYQTTFPANVAMNGYSTFPRKHSSRTQDSSNGNYNNNNSSPPLPPRQSVVSSSPAVPPKSSSRAAFLQRQFSQQTNSSSNVTGRPSPSVRSFNTSAGITTNQAGHVQHRHSSSSSSSLCQSSLPHSSVDGGGKYMTAPRPATRRSQKPQQPNQNSVETAIDSMEIENYHSSPAHSQRLNNKIGAKVTNLVQSNNTTTTHLSNDSISSTINNDNNNNNNNNLTTNSRGNMVTAMPKPSWQVARHVEQSSSSHEMSSSSSESSPQSLIRSNHQNNSSMQESSSAQSISSAPLSSQPWGTVTPSHSDSSSSLSSLSHTQPTRPRPTGPVRSDSSGSVGGSAQPPPVLESQSGGSVGSINNNSLMRSSADHFDNGLRHSSFTSTSNPITNPVPPNSPSSFASRLSSRSDGHINTISLKAQQQQAPQQITSSFSLLNSVAHSSSSGSPTTPNRSLSYHSPTSSPNLSNARSSYPASRSMDLSCLTKKPSMDPGKRTSVDSLLSQTDSLSPTGSSRDDLDGRSSSCSSTAASRRLSPQSAVHMGISSVQRKLQEQERTKKEYETEVHALREQLLEAQERLQQAEMRLLDHEVDTHQLMDQWQSRLVESEEKMRKQQEEKDEKMKEIISKLQSIEDELKKEQEEMSEAVEQKQQVIEVQEQRIRTLDLANQKLLHALAELKGRAIATQKKVLNSDPKGKDLALEIASLKTSSC